MGGNGKQSEKECKGKGKRKRRLKTNSSMAAFFVKRTFWGCMHSSADGRRNLDNTLALAISRFPDEAETGRSSTPRKMKHHGACKPTAA
jgi:hypothetical protein